MKKTFTTLSIAFILTLLGQKAMAQFAGPFAIANWSVFSNNSNGTTNTGGAPNYITQTSSDGLSGAGWNDFRINIAVGGTLTFNWAYSTNDGPFYDYPQVYINGVVAYPTGFSQFGGNIQSGTQNPIVLCPGDVFGFRAHSTDNVAGPCTTTFSALSFTSAPGISVTATPNSTSTCAGSSVALSASGALNFTWNPGGATGATVAVTPTANTIYTVTGSSGCAAGTATVDVTAFPLPVLSITGQTTVCSGSTVSLTASGASSYSWSNGSMTASTSATPVTNTVYTVYGTSTLGCVGVKTQSVEAMPLPDLSVSGPSEICEGSAVTLTAAGADSYFWSTGATTSTISQTPLVATTFSVVGSHTLNACTKAAFHAVSVNTVPNMAISGSSSLCAGQSATLTACCADGYFWSNGATTSSIVVTPNASANYSVVGVNMKGCSRTVSAVVPVFSCVGLNEQNADGMQVLLYPNPSNGELFVELPASAEVSVYNYLGQMVAELKGAEGVNSIDLRSQPAGMYLVTVKISGQSRTLRILIQ